MLFVWPFGEVVFKQKERNNRCAEALYQQRTQHTHTHTHTNTNLTTDLMFSVPNNYNSLLWLHGPALGQLFKTVALQLPQQTLTARRIHRQSACIHDGRLLESGNVFEEKKLSFSTCLLWTLRNIVHIIQWIQRNTVHSKWIQRNTVNIQMTLRKTIHRIFDGYRSIMSTQYSMDIAQYCPQNIQFF